MLKFAKTKSPEKPGRPCFLASFITMESSKISSSTADLYSWRSLSTVLGHHFTVVPRWLGGYRTGFWIRGWGFESPSLNIPYGVLRFMKMNYHWFSHFEKIQFQQIKMKKILVLQYANNIDKIVGYTAILTTKSVRTSVLSILSVVFVCYGLKVCIIWS